MGASTRFLPALGTALLPVAAVTLAWFYVHVPASPPPAERILASGVFTPAPAPPPEAPPPGELRLHPRPVAARRRHGQGDGMVEVKVLVRPAEGSSVLRGVRVYLLPPGVPGYDRWTVKRFLAVESKSGHFSTRVRAGPRFLGIVSPDHLPLLRSIAVPESGLDVVATLDGGATLTGRFIDSNTGLPDHPDSIDLYAGSDPLRPDPDEFPGEASPPGFARTIELDRSAEGRFEIRGLPPGPCRIAARDMAFQHGEHIVEVPGTEVQIPLLRKKVAIFRFTPPLESEAANVEAVVAGETGTRRFAWTINWTNTSVPMAPFAEGRWSAEFFFPGVGSAFVVFSVGPGTGTVEVPVHLMPVQRVRIRHSDGAPMRGFVAVDPVATGEGGVRDARSPVRLMCERHPWQTVDLEPGPWVARWTHGGEWAQEEFTVDLDARTEVALRPLPATLVVARTGAAEVRVLSETGAGVMGILFRPDDGMAGTRFRLRAGSRETLVLPANRRLSLRVEGREGDIPLVPGTLNEIDFPEE